MSEPSDRQRGRETLRRIFEERIPFNRWLGLRVESVDPGRISLSFETRPEYVGNFLRGSLHGGVISATLDVAGGLAAFVEVMESMGEVTEAEILDRLAGLGTIDLRVDFLRPGSGRRFTATAFIQRAGNRVAVTRMELHNDNDELIAVATGAYMVG